MRQLPLVWSPSDAERLRLVKANGLANKVMPEDRAFHDWYRFVLSFPPHLVQDYIKDFSLGERHTILDPFCGTGTTLIEAKLAGIRAVGLEANPFAQFASSVKIDWDINYRLLRSAARKIAKEVAQVLASQGINDDLPCDSGAARLELRTLSVETQKLLVKDSISPLPLHKSLVLLEQIQTFQDQDFYNHLLLAFANALVFAVSNLHFGPEVGVKRNGIKKDTPVLAPWLSAVDSMTEDLERVADKRYPRAAVYLADARGISSVIAPCSVDALITSPPYPNEKDYSRTTRLESVMLGFVADRQDLQTVKKQLLRSNTRGVYKADDDDTLVADNTEIQRIAEQIERRREEMGKTSGFERLYARVARLYFGGMKRHLSDLREVLRPGARLAYVVGDQASYLRVLIRTGDLIAGIAQPLGYELVRKDLFRTRFSTATREQLREEVVILRWPG